MFIIGNRQHFGVRSTEIFEKRETELRGRGPGGSERDSKNRVRAELCFVRRAIERNHRLIHANLIDGIHSDDFFGNGSVDVPNCLGHALAKKKFFRAVAQLPCFVFAGTGTTWDNGATAGSSADSNYCFNGWITARIDDLATVDLGDFGLRHFRFSLRDRTMQREDAPFHGD